MLHKTTDLLSCENKKQKEFTVKRLKSRKREQIPLECCRKQRKVTILNLPRRPFSFRWNESVLFRQTIVQYSTRVVQLRITSFPFLVCWRYHNYVTVDKIENYDWLSGRVWLMTGDYRSFLTTSILVKLSR